ELGAPPEIRSVPDPRLRDDQYKLIQWLSGEIERYFQECLDQGTFPQLWVPCGAAASLLDLLADRLRYSLGSPEAKRLGELLTYSAERYPHHGQQALLTATGALAQH